MKVSLTHKWAAYKTNRRISKELKQFDRDFDRQEIANTRAQAMAQRHTAAGLALPPADLHAFCKRLDNLSPSQLAWCVTNLPGLEAWPCSETEKKQFLGAPYPAPYEIDRK